MSNDKRKPERRIYCRFCGAKLKRDAIGWKCPTVNCDWEHGVDDEELLK